MDSQSLWDELLDLMEQARTEFGHLRDLPAYGRKQWERYFQKSFQVYARLWSFQQDNRSALQNEGLKRWEIGEVASRIGQLYYNYYLRTSGLNFLSESYIFYEAIHERGYFASEDEEDLLVKQLRYYTRFITVCLLLGKREEVWDHLDRLQQLVDEFAEEAQPTDVLEWRLVVQEIRTFLAADSPLGSGKDRRAGTLPIRCQPESPLAGIPFTAPFLRLHEAVLASYWHRQVKLGDLPLDSLRMLQALEWEDPTASGSVSPDNRHHNGEYWARGGDGSVEHENPAKYLLYRPTASEILAVLATACESLPPVSAILVYISAAEEHVRAQVNSSASRQQLAEVGSADPTPAGSQDDAEELSGVCLSPPSSSGLDESYLYPEDILPHTRRPLLLVIDSNNSRAFKGLAGRERSYPPCCLMSPIAEPPGVRPLVPLPGAGDAPASCSPFDTLAVPSDCSPVAEASPAVQACTAGESGRLFTLFLTSPVTAMCALVGLRDVDGLALATFQKTAEAALFGIGEELALQAGADWNDPWVAMFGDVLLRRLILHFLLCRAALALHKEHGSVEDYQPTCFPPFPPVASTTADVVVDALLSITKAMGCSESFHTSGPSRQKSFSESETWQAGLHGGRTLSMGSFQKLK